MLRNGSRKRFPAFCTYTIFQILLSIVLVVFYRMGELDYFFAYWAGAAMTVSTSRFVSVLATIGPALPGQQDPARLRPVLVAAGLVAEGEDRCLDAVLQAEFGEDAADVGLNGLLADREVPGDLPVAVPAGD